MGETYTFRPVCRYMIIGQLSRIAPRFFIVLFRYLTVIGV